MSCAQQKRQKPKFQSLMLSFVVNGLLPALFFNVERDCRGDYRHNDESDDVAHLLNLLVSVVEVKTHDKSAS